MGSDRNAEIGTPNAECDHAIGVASLALAALQARSQVNEVG